jgi:hypothetical protein
MSSRASSGPAPAPPQSSDHAGVGLKAGALRFGDMVIMAGPQPS